MITKFGIFDGYSIKEYDFEYKGKWVYFKLCNLKGPLELYIAINKLDKVYRDLFFEFYGLPNLDHEYEEPKTIYSVYNIGNEIPGRMRCENYENIDFIGKYEELEFLGDIHVEDFEVSSTKYNL